MTPLRRKGPVLSVWPERSCPNQSTCNTCLFRLLLTTLPFLYHRLSSRKHPLVTIVFLVKLLQVLDIFRRAEEDGASTVDCRRDDIEDSLITSCSDTASLVQLASSHPNPQGDVPVQSRNSLGKPRTAFSVSHLYSSCHQGNQRYLRTTMFGGHRQPLNRYIERNKVCCWMGT